MNSLAWVAVLLCLASPAAAAVFEVNDDGTVAQLDRHDAAQPAARPSPRGTSAVTRRAAAYQPAVDRAARQYEVSPALIDAIARVESRYDPAAVSRAKATGIMQLMPATARAMGVGDATPAANIRGGAAYVRVLLERFDGDVVRTIAAYNAGPAAVRRAGGVPHFAETQAYVAAVLDRLAAAAQ